MPGTSSPLAALPPGPPFERTRYDGAVMICGKCQKRDTGPSGMKAKDLRQDFRDALGEARRHLRIVQTSCLGLCPKKAIAVAALAPSNTSLLAAVRDKDDVRAVARRLTAVNAER